MTFTTRSVEETYTLAQRLVRALKNRKEVQGAATVLALTGNLGAGKTAFVKGMARALELPDTVTSPTFVIEKIYYLEEQPWSMLVHIDAYRLESDDELHAIGWYDAVTDPHNLIAIEWPENVALAIPDRAVTLSFEVEDETTRSITIEGIELPDVT